MINKEQLEKVRLFLLSQQDQLEAAGMDCFKEIGSLRTLVVLDRITKMYDSGDDDMEIIAGLATLGMSQILPPILEFWIDEIQQQKED